MKTTFPQFDFDSFRQRANKSWYLLRKLCFSMMKKFLTFVFSQVKRNKLSVSPGGKNKRAKRYSLFFQSVEKRFTWGFASFSSLFSEFSQFSTISFNLFQKFSQIWKKLVEKFFFSEISRKEKMLKNAFSPSGIRKIMIRELLKTWWYQYVVVSLYFYSICCLMWMTASFSAEWKSFLKLFEVQFYCSRRKNVLTEKTGDI